MKSPDNPPQVFGQQAERVAQRNKAMSLLVEMKAREAADGPRRIAFKSDANTVYFTTPDRLDGLKRRVARQTNH